MSVMHPLCICWSHIFHLFPNINRGIAAVSSVALPLRVYRPMLRTDSAVILVLAINSLKIKQMVDSFCFAVAERLRAEMISKLYLRPFYRFRIRLRNRNSGFEKKRFGIILDYLIILKWTSLPFKCIIQIVVTVPKV